jgi:hypothetical protein
LPVCSTDLLFGKTIPVPEAGDAKVGCCGYFPVSPFDFAFSMRFLVQFFLANEIDLLFC